MKLRTHLFILFLVILLLFAMVFVLVKNGIVLRSFKEIEYSLAVKEMERVVAALEQEEAALRGFVSDWGEWDDSYAFIQDANQEFIASNLLLETFYSSKNDLIYFVALNGRVVWGRIYDVDEEKDVALDLFSREAISPDSLFLQHSEKQSASRLLLTSHGPMFIACIDMQPSSGSGKSRGTLVMGRFLDEPMLDRLRIQTRESFQVWPMSAVGSDSVLAEMAARLSQDGGPLVVEVDDSMLHLYTRYDDQPDKRGLLIRVDVPRHMMAQVNRIVSLAGFIFCTAAAILLCVASVVVRRLIVLPLQEMDRAVGGIRQNNDLARRLSGDGAQEINSLISQFNALLAQLEVNRNNEISIQKDLVQARQRAEQATASKADFLANMSHEIRTPMNGIIGLVELVQRTPLNDKQHDYLQKLSHSSKLLLSIINDILDFSKIEAGKMEFEEISFELQEVLDTLATALSLTCEEKGLELLFDVAEVPTYLRGDPLRLGQVLINLVSNAVKFTDQGQIVVTVSCHAGEAQPGQVLLEFSVQDSGIGLSATQAKAIFRSFNQADISTTRKYGGTGLGLTICSYLVEMMGGEIWVDSTLGQGSTFTFTVRCGLQSTLGETEALCPAALMGSRVLVVDDNPVALRIHGRLLSSLGFTVSEVSSGAEALSILADASGGEPYRLVLLDWKMAGMDGIATSQGIQRLELEVVPKIIMVSAYGRVEEIGETAAAGIAIHLLKPITTSILCTAIKDVFGLATKTTQIIDPVPAPLSLAGVRVLLVDDVEVNQLVTQELLEQAGCQVVVADNGLDAITFVREASSPFDLILMDIQMPGIDGFEATRRIRSLPGSSSCDFSQLPIIAMTAHALAETGDKCFDAGMDDHLAKPISPESLLAMVEKWGT